MLLTKLTYFNFSANSIQWVRSYLSNRKQCVLVNGTKSPYLVNPVGVPQGSILGPLLFSLYINDLPNVCPDLNVQMYADDAVIFVHGKNTEIISSCLSNNLDKVQHWLNNNCLQLYAKKTVCMMLSKRPVKIEGSNVFLNGAEIELVPLQVSWSHTGLKLDF